MNSQCIIHYVYACECLRYFFFTKWTHKSVTKISRNEREWIETIEILQKIYHSLEQYKFEMNTIQCLDLPKKSNILMRICNVLCFCHWLPASKSKDEKKKKIKIWVANKKNVIRCNLYQTMLDVSLNFVLARF